MSSGNKNIPLKRTDGINMKPTTKKEARVKKDKAKIKVVNRPGPEDQSSPRDPRPLPRCISTD